MEEAVAESAPQIVNREEVLERINQRKGKVEKRYLERTVREKIELTKESLKLFLQQEGDFQSPERKFIRAGDKLYFVPFGDIHVDLAIVTGLIPEDAGIIRKGPGGEIMVYGKSLSLGIEENNTNRMATEELIRSLDPTITVTHPKEPDNTIKR